MKIKIIGSISSELKDKLSLIKFEFVEDSSKADFVIVSSKIGSYFLNTTVGSIIEEAYDLEFSLGKPLVLSDKEFINKRFEISNEAQA